ncbi:MAG TPA: mechanosensitive ion channel family protein [Nitrososphaeraceae archaeon]|jgi:small-conductance mechanosensitive channel
MTDRQIDKNGNYIEEQETGIKSLKKTVITGVILILSVGAITLFLEGIVPETYLKYIKIAEVGIIGYFFIVVVSEAIYRVTRDYFRDTAKAIKAFIKITSAIIFTAIILSYLSNDPFLAASITTVTGLILAFASQTIIGNMIAGMYLSLTRPFKIGDRITIVGQTGTIFEIGLLYTRLLTEQGDTILAPSSVLANSAVVLYNDQNKP